MTHIDLFSGIGGFAYAAKQVWGDGYHNLFFCDNSKFCQAVLRKNFGRDIKIIEDIKYLTLEEPWEKFVLNVESQTAPQVDHIVNRVTQREQGCGATGIGKNIRPTPEGTTKKKSKKSLIIMGANAPVVGNPLLSSLPLTTNLITETGNEKNIRHILGSSPSSADCQKIIKSSVTTAIMPERISESARTKEVKVDLLTAGVPCQPASCAGKRKGKSDDRWLWGETFEVIRRFKPTWYILENVRGLVTLEQGVVFDSLLTELEGMGYEVQTFCIPACAVNAPHRRDRVWIVAENAINRRNGRRHYGDSDWSKRALQIKGSNRHAADTAIHVGQSGLPRENEWGMACKNKQTIGWQSNWLEVATRLCRVDDGLPAIMDGVAISKSKHREERLKALGNAIVPQVAVEIMKAIKEAGA